MKWKLLYEYKLYIPAVRIYLFFCTFSISFSIVKISLNQTSDNDTSALTIERKYDIFSTRDRYRLRAKIKKKKRKQERKMPKGQS